MLNSTSIGSIQRTYVYRVHGSRVARVVAPLFPTKASSRSKNNRYYIYIDFLVLSKATMEDTLDLLDLEVPLRVDWELMEV